MMVLKIGGECGDFDVDITTRAASARVMKCFFVLYV